MKKILSILLVSLCFLICGCGASKDNHSKDITKYNYNICKKAIGVADDFLTTNISADEAIETLKEYENSMDDIKDYDGLAKTYVYSIRSTIYLMKNGNYNSQDVQEIRDELAEFIGYK